MVTYGIKLHHITNIGQVNILNILRDIILLANDKKHMDD